MINEQPPRLQQDDNNTQTAQKKKRKAAKRCKINSVRGKGLHSEKKSGSEEIYSVYKLFHSQS